jgi:hypothetical protein
MRLYVCMYGGMYVCMHACVCIYNIILYICYINDIYKNIIYYACGGSAAACSDAGEYLCMYACMYVYACI